MVADFLARAFWGVLDNSFRHFINTLSPETARARYMDPKSVRLLGTRLGRMAEKLSCNEPLMNVSFPRQWLRRGATAAAGYQSVVPISKYQGGWQPPAGYPPYVPKNQVEYAYHLVVIAKNEARGRAAIARDTRHRTIHDRAWKNRKSFGHSTQKVIQGGRTQMCTLR